MPGEQWETMLVALDPTIAEQSARLERHGKDGWSLVAVSGGIAYLQRRVLDLPPPEPQYEMVPNLDFSSDVNRDSRE